MACSFHNHAVEFQTKDGVRPIDILAKSKDLVFHIDVEVCRRAGTDPVAFMKQYPGKTECLLLTEGPLDANRHAPALGKGDTPWKDVFRTAESFDEASPDRDYSSQVPRPRYPPPRWVSQDCGRLPEDDCSHGPDWHRRHLQYGRRLRKSIRSEHEDERALPRPHH